MSSITTDLVKAVKDYLLIKQFSFEIAFTRENLPIRLIEETNDPTFLAAVYPGGRTSQRWTRSAFMRRFVVNVGVYTVGQAALDREDELITVGEEIEECLFGTVFKGIGPGQSEMTRQEEGDVALAPFIPAELESQGVVMVIVPATYSTITEQPIQVGTPTDPNYVRDEDEDYLRDDQTDYVGGA